MRCCSPDCSTRNIEYNVAIPLFRIFDTHGLPTVLVVLFRSRNCKGVGNCAQVEGGNQPTDNVRSEAPSIQVPEVLVFLQLRIQVLQATQTEQMQRKLLSLSEPDSTSKTSKKPHRIMEINHSLISNSFFPRCTPKYLPLPLGVHSK